MLQLKDFVMGALLASLAINFYISISLIDLLSELSIKEIKRYTYIDDKKELVEIEEIVRERQKEKEKEQKEKE